MGTVNRLLAAVALLATVVGCGRIGYDGPYDQVLTVDVVEDRMAGATTIESPSEVGAVGLSLREALTIANNTGGSTLVEFEPSSFPPGARTEIDLGSELPVTGSSTTIDCGGRAGLRTNTLLLDSVSDVTVTGCRFSVSAGDAIRVVDSSGVLIHDNSFSDSGGHAIVAEVASGECKNLLIKNNHIEIAGSDLVAIYDCLEVYVGDNLMIVGDKGAQRGVHFERVLYSTIADNIIDPGEARMINFQDASENLIEGNVLEGAHAGVVLYGASNDNTIAQNVAMDMAYDGVYVNGEALGNTIIHNTFFRCAAPIADRAPDTSTDNNLTSDEPTDFVDPTPGVYDFTLAAGSPHIDAGEDLGYDCLPDDPAARFLGAAPDLGAVESY